MLVNSINVQAQDSLQTIVNATPLSGGQSQNFSDSSMNEQDLQLGASSTPPISKRALLYQTMGGSPITLDLTAISDTLFGTQDFSNGGGSSVATSIQFLKIINKGANLLLVQPGASNPYYFDAANTAYAIPLPPGASVKFRFNGAANQVLSTEKTIKLTGTSGDTYWIEFLGG
jgi:hypothetical protein